MNSPSPTKYPNRDGLPLSQLSPERVNGRVAKGDDIAKPTTPIVFSSPIRRKVDEISTTAFFNPGIPQSPSLPETPSIKEHIRMNTDVSGLVKRFEHLDVRDREAESAERRRKQEEALNRAKIAREEAETEVAKCKEELRAQKKEYEETKARERKACRRIEILMDDMTRAKDQWSSQASIYEKEVRRARKEAFKSSSAVLKLQEDTKHSQNEANVLRSKLDLADRKASKSEEDKFTAQYQLVAVQEELEKLRSSLRIAEEERERLKRSMQEEDVIRIASQGSIALPDCDADAGAESVGTRDAPLTNDALQDLSLAEIRAQMLLEKRRRYAAEGLVDFLKLECQFRCCRCMTGHGHRDGQAKTAALEDEKARTEHGLDQSVALAHQPERTVRDKISQPPASKHIDEVVDAHKRLEEKLHLRTSAKHSITLIPDHTLDDTKSHNDKLMESPEGSPAAELPLQAEHQSPITPTLQQSSTKPLGSWREVSKTVVVPMHFTPSPKKHDADQAMTPLDDCPEELHREKSQQDPKTYPFDREAALAAIAYRRGRAKSFAQSNATPKRPVIDRITDRRDISAPAVTG